MPPDYNNYLLCAMFQGEPVFKNLTSDCQYQFLWKTSVICQPFTKNVSVSEEQCILNNEQMNASMDLKALGQHGVMQVPREE
jgi:hypothetical protein